MSSTLDGKVAVVTGAGGGIGRGIALAMAAEGARVVVNDLGCAPDGENAGAPMADAVVGEIKEQGGQAVPNYDSVATMDGARAIVQQAIDSFGKIDVLVNNAGITRVKMLWDMTEKDWDDVIATNLKGIFTCIKAAMPHMIEQRSGRIINFSSDMSLRGGTGVAGYSASKAGVLGLTFTAALELGMYGITVNAIWPGATSRMRDAGVEWRSKYRVYMPRSQKAAPATKPDLDPENVAPIVVYLARDEAKDINAQVFRASSGSIERVMTASTVASIRKEERWTQDELSEVVPNQLTKGLENPSPPSEKPVWPWML